MRHRWQLGAVGMVMVVILVIAVVVAMTLGACGPRERPDAANRDDLSIFPGDLAIAWNQRVLEIAVAEDRLLTLKGVRTLSMMHLALHDALNAAVPVYASYEYSAGGRDGEPTAQAEPVDPVAAAVQAAHAVAVHQYPDRRAELDAELERWLQTVPTGPARDAGVAIGTAAAAAMLRSREGDGWDLQAEYRFQPMAPGVYVEFSEHSATPQGFVFGTGWATARPFFLERADQFRAAPPPPIDSAAYAIAFDEVREVGRATSRARTPDQTHLALWWKEFAESSMNRLARELAVAEKLNLWEAARLFAFVNADLYDGYVSVFESKFFYNHWRPYTAIRWAANDGNPNTAPELDWDNTHHHTYAFPSYPSAHGTACAVAMSVFAKTFGDDHAFAMTTPEVNAGGPLSPMIRMEPPTRSFTSFSSAALECAVSRVYLGIHFRYDSEAGNQLGRRIADASWDRFLRPLAPGASAGR